MKNLCKMPSMIVPFLLFKIISNGNYMKNQKYATIMGIVGALTFSSASTSYIYESIGAHHSELKRLTSSSHSLIGMSASFHYSFSLFVPFFSFSLGSFSLFSLHFCSSLFFPFLSLDHLFQMSNTLRKGNITIAMVF